MKKSVIQIGVVNICANTGVRKNLSVMNTEAEIMTSIQMNDGFFVLVHPPDDPISLIQFYL